MGVQLPSDISMVATTISAPSVTKPNATSSKLASPSELRDLRKALDGSTASNGACLAEIRRLLSDASRAVANQNARVSRSDAREKIMSVRGAAALLEGIGFVDTGTVLELPSSVTKGRMDTV